LILLNDVEIFNLTDGTTALSGSEAKENLIKRVFYLYED